MASATPISAPKSTDPAYIEAVVAEAQRQNIQNESAWQKLLYRRSKIFGPKSVIDEPAFFLAGPRGKSDAAAELEATLRRLLGEETMRLGEKSYHPQCIFAARFAYLKKRLKLDETRMHLQDCEELRDFVHFAQYNGVSLIFSNYFANNPASMFGHTFLRLHRPRDGTKAGLLDDAVNFAAQIAVMNPLTYPFQGLLGLFRGRFALLPYSEKIQEYNNYESRDLWEYKLNLNAEEIQMLPLAIWEAGYFWMDYFYLDENCSYMMLALLEVAKPELELTSQFNLYAIPSDTLKVVARTPGLVTEVGFKPSAQTRYLERAHALSAEEKATFSDVIARFRDRFDASEFEDRLRQSGCDEACRARLLDTLIEYIDYKEKKVSTVQVETFKGLRPAVLLARARLHTPSPPLTERPERSRPDLGPRSAAVSLDWGRIDGRNNLYEFRWRPAFHDLSSSDLGYSNQLQIQILDTQIDYDQHDRKIYLRHFSPVELTSLGQNHLALSPISWRFSLQMDTDRSKQLEHDYRHRESLQVGVGMARFSQSLGVYAFANVMAGYSDDLALLWHLGAGPRVGSFLKISERFKLAVNWDWTKFLGRKTRGVERREVMARLNYFASRDHELYGEFRDMDGLIYGGLGFRYFY